MSAIIQQSSATPWEALNRSPAERRTASWEARTKPEIKPMCQEEVKSGTKLITEGLVDPRASLTCQAFVGPRD